MDKNGKKFEILIEDSVYADDKTGVEIISDSKFIVWADEESMQIINDVEGVIGVYSPVIKTKYLVFTDPRYDFEFIKKEVEAVLMCI